MVKRLIFAFVLICNISLAKDITLVLDWFPNTNHGPILVAKALGYFKPLNVHLITPTDTSAAPKLVAAGKADIGIDYQTHYVIQHQKQWPIVYVGNLIDSPLDVMVTLKSSGITQISQLSGKSIAASSQSVFLKKWLAANHVKNAKIVSVNYDLIQALLSKKVDAVNGLDRNLELIQLKNMHIPVNVFYPEKTGMPHYNELIYIINKKDVGKPWVKQFFKAITKATQFIHQHPKKAWRVITNHYPALKSKLNEQSWMETVQYFPIKPNLENLVNR